ncbi:uncharacterized protein LOC111592209 [Drosophila hydei]|uniref:Uncharacterized protein LOC111592209 n=1 Tax=Drosophila hydei TaxID=7224 RepID=A0A6J1L7F3_DROHY|nr:uncharacterized protein LOC111592209 [Drosophila hydei]
MKLKLLALICCIEYLSGMANAKCFYISTTKETWFTAVEKCKELKLCLGDLQSASEFLTFTQKIPETMRADYWFGTNHPHGPKSRSLTTYSKLIIYAPILSFINVRQQCAFMYPNVYQQYSVSMANCREKKRFICYKDTNCGVSNGITEDLSGLIPCVIKPEFRKELDINAKYFDDL